VDGGVCLRRQQLARAIKCGVIRCTVAAQHSTSMLGASTCEVRKTKTVHAIFKQPLSVSHASKARQVNTSCRIPQEHTNTVTKQRKRPASSLPASTPLVNFVIVQQVQLSLLRLEVLSPICPSSLSRSLPQPTSLRV
jgi:hypothetical protein